MTRKVCWQCIGEDIVRAEIRVDQPRRTCSYCGSRRPAIRIEDLARRVEPVYQNIFGEAVGKRAIWFNGRDTRAQIEHVKPRYQKYVATSFRRLIEDESDAPLAQIGVPAP